MNRKRLMRAFTSLLLLAFVLSVLAGCGVKVEPVPTAEATATAEPTPAPTPAATATPAPTAKPTATPQPSEVPQPETTPDGGGESEEKPIPEPIVNADGSVTVFTVAQLISALAPGADIVLAEGTYNVSEFYAEAIVENGADTWGEHWYISWGALCLYDLQDITIRAQEGSRVEIVTADAYASVLGFSYCDNVVLDGLIMGHIVEPGHCTGAVLELSYCQNTVISNLDLYGCGTYGIYADHCIGIHAADCVIRECSYGIMHLYVSSDADFQRCTMRDCRGYEQLALYYSIVSFTDCVFQGNEGEYGFLSDTYTNEISFKSCSFDAWASEMLEQEVTEVSRVSVEGSSSIDDGMRECRPVSIEELLEEIQPNTRILLQGLEPGTLNLSEYLNWVWAQEGEAWNERHEYVKIMECYDGLELVVRDVDRLSIIGSLNGDPSVYECTVDPRYAAVLNFLDCSNIELRGLTLGHTELGECSGNVLNFEGCWNVMLRDLDIYGCGFQGVSFLFSDDLFAYNCTIRDCSAGPYCFEENSGDICFIGCTLSGSYGGGANWNEDTSIYFLRCTFGPYESSSLLYRDDVITDCCEWSDEFVGEYPDIEYEEPTFDPASADSIPFDANLLTSTYWVGWRMIETGSGFSFDLPYETDDGYTQYALEFEEDGSGTFSRLVGDAWTDIPITWVCAANYSADIFTDDSGVSKGSIALYFEEHDDDGYFSRYWLKLSMEGLEIWFF